ncbi:MAG: DUF6807 family protein [Betaproteobacteria bacterium]
MKPSGYTLGDEQVALPPGAFAGTRRTMLRLDGQAVLGVTAGMFRPYLHPVYTPAGMAATTESPADHPHHHSIWVGADHLHLVMPALGGRAEVYAYNCYVNDVFQGRAPGRILQTGLTGHLETDGFHITQQIEWRGPVEWAAPQGRLVLNETRRTRVSLRDQVMVLDVRCEIRAAGHDIAIGPTRHAWFNFRVAPSMCVDEGGRIDTQGGRRSHADQVESHASWVSLSGPAGGGLNAGIAMAPGGRWPWWWFVSDWGVATASPCRDQAIELASGSQTVLEARYLVYDGEFDPFRCTPLLQAGSAL